MRSVDVAIVGAGTAGAMAATMLGRAGYGTVLIDPIHPFGADFRCEKIEHTHADALRNAGLLDEITPAGRRYEGIWIARQGRFVEIVPMVEYGIDYGALVNRIRDLLPANVAFLNDKVIGAQLDARRSIVELASGEKIEARLVVAASGLNPGLLEALKLERRMISRAHSLSIGFDVAPEGRSRFDFDALTYFGEDPQHRVAYLTLFPVAGHVRANLFVYREVGDPWIKEFRRDPVAAMFAAMPNLKTLTGDFTVVSQPKFRAVDLVATEPLDKPGLVLVGDAYSTACPVSGTGASKAMVDVERLCNVHIPRWLAGDTIDADTIAQFYNDPAKVASDRHSRAISLFAKRLALETSPLWAAYRWARFFGAAGRYAFNRMRKSVQVTTTKPSGVQWQQQ